MIESRFIAAVAVAGAMAFVPAHAESQQTFCARVGGGPPARVQAVVASGSELNAAGTGRQFKAHSRYAILPWAGMRAAVIELLEPAAATLTGRDLNGRPWQLAAGSFCL